MFQPVLVYIVCGLALAVALTTLWNQRRLNEAFGKVQEERELEEPYPFEGNATYTLITRDISNGEVEFQGQFNIEKEVEDALEKYVGVSVGTAKGIILFAHLHGTAKWNGSLGNKTPYTRVVLICTPNE